MDVSVCPYTYSPFRGGSSISGGDGNGNGSMQEPGSGVEFTVRIAAYSSKSHRITSYHIESHNCMDVYS